MSVPGKCFRHDVSDYALRRAVFQLDCTEFDVIPDEVEFDVDMLSPSVVCRILCQCNCELCQITNSFPCTNRVISDAHGT